MPHSFNGVTINSDSFDSIKITLGKKFFFSKTSTALESQYFLVMIGRTSSLN